MHRQWFTIAAIIVGTLMWRVIHPTGEVLTDLMFGWIAFLYKVLPEVELNFGGILVCLAAIIVSLALLHHCLKWLVAAVCRSGVSWRLRNSVNVLLLVLLIFAAGTCGIGATHQAVWIATSDQPVFGRHMDNRFRESKHYQLKYLGLGLATEADVAGGLLATQARENSSGKPPHSWATHSLIYLSYMDVGLNKDLEWTHPDNKPFFSRPLPSVLNPDFRHTVVRNPEGYAVSHFAGNSLIFESDQPTVFPQSEAVTCVLVGEVNRDFAAWGDPGNDRDPRLPFNRTDSFGGSSADEVMFLMTDGSCQTISTGIDPTVQRRLADPHAE
jgi:hypothetical protein